MTGSYQRVKRENSALLEEDLRCSAPLVRACPSTICLAHDYRCNLACIMCSQRARTSTREHRLEPDIFAALAERLFPTAELLQLNTAGEPLMSRSLDLELEYAERYEVKIDLRTNGTLLSPRARRTERVLRNSACIAFSLDSPDKATYEQIRVGGSFDKVVRNMKFFQRWRLQMPPGERPLFVITMVLMRRNLHQLPAMVDLACELGADALSAGPLIAHVEQIQNERIQTAPDEARRFGAAARERARAGALFLTLPPQCMEQSEREHRAAAEAEAASGSPCPFLWERTYVDMHARVIACCSSYNPIMGDLHQQSFDQIWNNDRYQGMRAGLGSGKPQPPCDCCLSSGYLAITRGTAASFAPRP